ncbi:hypothetical protein BKG91_09380 [Rodentibacter caecimuris]|uniref:Uncharacterized protein n=1 Tax=Rodentibacter caecimuris TaxID=1796644 RepID=A0A9X8W0K6_9PAST|nr:MULTISPECIES: phage protein [Pasteurellaceae]AOF54432.1 hypothetical protein AC062_2346 [Pasteurellaceae bacterium NI1060]MCR1838539.1 DUF3277 family protein [Pasteurella caecimuris]MCU0107850.1 DUF3277 family protein [Pasteurella caecimuris]OOF72382.1 hypothetical protein BKG90_04640 [Rodentibacter heylii]OOF73353.1 hypothetical protein BKG91_09380 [Rodentibacter heylii]
MAIFDPKQVVVLLDGKEIDDWADGSDVISALNQVDAGQLIIGADGSGVFIANPDKSGKLTLKIKQHSPDNAYLNKLFNQQKNSIKTFMPFTLAIRDLINDDVVTATKGYFTTPTPYTRGNGYNAQTWTIVFEQMTINLEQGVQ